MIVDDDIKRLVLKTSDANQINELALKQGMITLQQDGILKVMEGITTIEEVLRVTRSMNRPSGSSGSSTNWTLRYRMPGFSLDGR